MAAEDTGMTSRLRIPGLIDLLRIDDPDSIADASEDTRLDREFTGGGPLLNRLVARRIRRTLRTPTAPLPSVSPRTYPRRGERQVELRTRLNGLVSAGTIAPDHVAELAAYVRGEREEDAIGPMAQEAIGRLFVSDYRATPQTWRAACVLEAAPRSMNLLRTLYWVATGAVTRSRRVLCGAVGDDPPAIHATAIAVHSLVRSLRAMRELWLEPGARDRMSKPTAVARSLRAPESVPRRWSAAATTKWGTFPVGALVLLRLDGARVRHPEPEITFMAASWSHCPAGDWTMALLGAVWESACSSESIR
jgi:hypothetical protein